MKIYFICFLLFLFSASTVFSQNLALPPKDSLVVNRTDDFEISGDGTAKNWAMSEWHGIPPQKDYQLTYDTKFKILYSEKGLYLLYQCEDKKLTNTLEADFTALFNEDVVEAFFWPDTEESVYLEYELSPLDYELILLVSNDKKHFSSWIPFHNGGDRKTRHATKIMGGKKEKNATVSGWTAEFFLPFALFKPLHDIPPKPGSRWRANFYRIDYDQEMALYSWQWTNGSFHEFEKFGLLIFE